MIADGSADGISDAEDFTSVSHSSGEWFLRHPRQLKLRIMLYPICSAPGPRCSQAKLLDHTAWLMALDAVAGPRRLPVVVPRPRRCRRVSANSSVQGFRGYCTSGVIHERLLSHVVSIQAWRTRSHPHKMAS